MLRAIDVEHDDWQRVAGTPANDDCGRTCTTNDEVDGRQSAARADDSDEMLPLTDGRCDAASSDGQRDVVVTHVASTDVVDAGDDTDK